MMAVASSQRQAAFRLDAWSPAFLHDPYPTYHALRAQAPVYHSPWGDWYLSRHADVARALADRTFVRRSPSGVNPMSAEVREPTSIERMLGSFMLFVDPPAHARLRALLGKAFTPPAIAALRPQIAALTGRLLDDAAAAPTFDLVEALSYPLPVIVISRMLGLSEADYPLLRDWSGKLNRGIDTGRLREMEVGIVAAEEFGRYMQDMVKQRRAAPRDDLITEIVAAADRDGTIGEEELVANLVMLLWAGHETTKNLISNAVLALLRHPAQMAALEAEPALMRNAVEEFLRYDSPVQKTVRWTAAPAEFGARTIPAGRCVLLLIGAANRDPAVFAEPDRLDIERSAGAHLAFGRGIHHCAGFAVARLEAEIALAAFLARTRERRLASDTIERQQTVSLRGPARLPLTVEWR